MPNFSPATEIAITYLLAIGEFLLCALPAILWVVIGRQSWREAFAWRRPMGREIMGAILLGFGLLLWADTIIVLQNHLWPSLIASQQSSSAFMLPLLVHHPWLFTLVMSGSAAIAEELFFRGPLQRALIKRLPTPVAIGVASFLFAAVHLDLQGFLVRVMLGVLLAVVVFRGKTLFPAIVLHFVYDVAAIGSSAWYVHVLGLKAVLRLSTQADMGANRGDLIGGSVVGTLLLIIGWRLCVSAWRLKLAQEEQAKLSMTDNGTVWPPAPAPSEE